MFKDVIKHQSGKSEKLLYAPGPGAIVGSARCLREEWLNALALLVLYVEQK